MYGNIGANPQGIQQPWAMKRDMLSPRYTISCCK
ncbi:DUF4113 domain-containing protein [Citrobacter freundii]